MNRLFRFLFLIGLIFFFAYLGEYLLISDQLFFNSLGEQLSFEQIRSLIDQNKMWSWLNYVILPLVTSVKLLLVASCLGLGLFFESNKINFKQLFGVVLKAEFVFLIPTILKILWFAFVQTNYTLKDLQFFYPLSVLSFFDASTIESWLVYPFQLLNVFEVVYWLVLAKGVQKIIQKDFTLSFEIVLASYGTGLVLWVAIVMFITVSYS